MKSGKITKPLTFALVLILFLAARISKYPVAILKHSEAVIKKCPTHNPLAAMGDSCKWSR